MATDEKKCPRCAETVKAEAKVCRYCGHVFETPEARSANEVEDSARRTAYWIVGLFAAAAIGASLWSGRDSPPAPAPTAAPPSAQDPAPCNALLAQGEEGGLIRGRPASNRIDVDERVWAELPAGSKRGFMLALRCSVLGGRPDDEPLGSYAVAYGWRSGKRLAMATSAGVRFE